MTDKQNLVVANELIGFQDDRFFKELTPIFEETGKLLKSNPSKKRDIIADFEAKLSIAIKNVTNINAMFTVYDSKELNATISLVGLSPGSVHSGFTADVNFASNQLSLYTERMEATKSANIEGMVDIKNSRVYGDFANIPFRGTISSEVLTTDLLTDRKRAFLVIHETGHAFNILSTIAETCVMAYHTSDAFSRLMKAEPKEYKLILDNTSKKIGYTNAAVIKEAAGRGDPSDVYRVYTSLMLRDRFASSKDPSGKFNHPSLEVAADVFAIRHGGYKEYLSFRSLSTYKYSSTYSLEVVARFIALHLFVQMGKFFLKRFAERANIAGVTLALMSLFLGKIMSAIARYVLGDAMMGIVFNKVPKATLMSDHAAVLKRELVERAKTMGLTPEELKFSAELLKEADEVIKATDKQEPWIFRITDKLLRAEGDRAIKDYADSQADLISNELFIKAKELENEAK